MENREQVEVLVNGKKREDEVTVRINTSAEIHFRINNLSQNSVLELTECTCDKPDVTLSDEYSVSSREDICVKIPPHEGYSNVKLSFKSYCVGKELVAVHFKLRRQSCVEFKITKNVVFSSMNNSGIGKELGPTALFRKSQRYQEERSLHVIESDQKPDFGSARDSLVMTLKLPRYSIPRKVKELLSSSRTDILNVLKGSSLELNYQHFFNTLLYVEEVHLKTSLKDYTIENAQLTRGISGLFVLKVPGLAENRPSVLRGDIVLATPNTGFSQYQGYVHEVTQDELHIGFSRRFWGQKCRIEFTVNRLSMRVAHRAVSMVNDSLNALKDVLFPVVQRTRLCNGPGRTQLRYHEKRINKEQKTAVEHILIGTSRPAPYLIYGPPGTGKTFTLVEAIKQVQENIQNSRILVCAPQNAAADIIASRLISADGNHKYDILRLQARSRKYEDVSSEIRNVSNYGPDRKVRFPEKEVLEKYRVIVVTLVTSGRLVSAEMGSHFTHIFIDEAGHATEPETVIPLAGLLDVNMKNGGQVVLAGDPKQLGPVIRSPLATERLGVSLLERLMDRDVYSRQQPYNRYNSDYVTKLVRSFRSHQDILKVPNDCFYDGELQVWADIVKRERFCNWEGLPKKGFPLIFHGVNGEEHREESSPSWFNVHEVDVVVSYVRQLLAGTHIQVLCKQIGIISPYHKQVKKIAQGLRKVLSSVKDVGDISIGSVEKFQGDEREVIIISTVRSQDKHLTDDKKFNLGFVNNAKRFNVAVTRAKALLIVVGNPAVLATDDNWRVLIKHIQDGGGYTGWRPPPEALNAANIA